MLFCSYYGILKCHNIVTDERCYFCEGLIQYNVVASVYQRYRLLTEITRFVTDNTCNLV